MRERLHLKKCKKDGRTKKKISHTEVEQKCYGGLAKKQNALYKNFKYDEETTTRTKVPEHLEEAKMLEAMLNAMVANLEPTETPDGIVGCEQVTKKRRGKKGRKEWRRVGVDAPVVCRDWVCGQKNLEQYGAIADTIESRDTERGTSINFIHKTKNSKKK